MSIDCHVNYANDTIFTVVCVGGLNGSLIYTTLYLVVKSKTARMWVTQSILVDFLCIICEDLFKPLSST